MDTLHVGLLGPIEAHVGGRAICLGGRHEQMVLAALALGLNQPVSTCTLVEAVWDGDPPRSQLDTLQSIVSRLRRRLGHEAIQSIDHSYRLIAEPDHVDAIRFERLLARASSMLADDPASAASFALDALSLWRSIPFGDLADSEFLGPDVRRLEALRLSALEVRLEADVECGRLATSIASLQGAIEENPYRERLWYLLVLALARDGRRVDALRACHRLRIDLSEVGIAPSADMCDLEQMVLTEAPTVRSHLRRSRPHAPMFLKLTS